MTRTGKPKEFVNIRGEVVQKSEKAVLFNIEGHGEEWIPRSQILGTVKNTDTVLRVAQWLCDKNGWESMAVDDNFDPMDDGI